MLKMLSLMRDTSPVPPIAAISISLKHSKGVINFLLFTYDQGEISSRKSLEVFLEDFLYQTLAHTRRGFSSRKSLGDFLQVQLQINTLVLC
jgi:hypothetical protein